MLERHFTEVSLSGRPVWKRGLGPFLFIEPEHSISCWLQIPKTSICRLSFTEIDQKAELLPGREMALPDRPVAQVLFLLESNLMMLER